MSHPLGSFGGLLDLDSTLRLTLTAKPGQTRWLMPDGSHLQITLSMKYGEILRMLSDLSGTPGKVELDMESSDDTQATKRQPISLLQYLQMGCGWPNQADSSE